MKQNDLDPKILEEKYWQLHECTDERAREQLLGEIRNSDGAMAAALEKMLAAEEQLDAFLEPDRNREPKLTGRLARTIDSQPAVLGSAIEVPKQIGPYKLLEPIGEGGMGVVYLAQQSKPVRRKVALKIIKPGMDSRQVIARFEAERQALAMMDHPNIAKVLDAGTTESGLPYFVMELVRGIPITEYCDRSKMSIRKRLELVCDACHAIQHAHNKSIIHRDIKPSNVLVTENDGTPLVKVIDFGVAKALTDNLTDKTMYTGVFQMIGTPLYMSPEQASLSNLDVDTRSDVYSLGVLVYELISGTLPMDRGSLQELSYDQLRRQICDTDSPRPSKRLSTLREQRETIAEHRGVKIQQLSGMIDGELDWIAMKAIEKDRSRRYQSSRELAEDVQRYLSGQAVQACPPTIAYKLATAYRRHRFLFWSAASLMLALVTGIAGTSWQAYRATLAENESVNRLAALEIEQEKTEAALTKAEEAEQLQRKLRTQAEASERESKWRLYVANLYPMRAAWQQRDFGKLDALLNASIPSDSEPDFRGWEWYFLQSQVRSRFRKLQFGDVSPGGPIAWCEATRNLATVSNEHDVQIWDVDREEERFSVSFDPAISVMEFSPQGDWLSVGTHSGEFYLIDLEDQRVAVSDPFATQLERHHRIQAISWKPDGTQVAILVKFGIIAIRDMGSGTVEILHRPESATYDGNIAWHPNKPLLAAGMRYGERRIYDLSTGEFKSLPRLNTDIGFGLSWDPSGERLATSENNDIRIVDSEGREESRLRGHLAAVVDIRWLDKKTIVSAARDHTVRVWSVDSKKPLATINAHATGLEGLVVDRRLRRSYSYEEASPGIRVCELIEKNDYSIKRVNSRGGLSVRCLRWSPDGTRLAAVGSHDGQYICAIWSADGHNPDAQQEIANSRGLDWSADGSRLIRFDETGAILIDDASTGTTLNSWRWNNELQAGGGQGTGVGFVSPDGRFAFETTGSGSFRLRQLKTLEIIANSVGNCGDPYQVRAAWRPDSQAVVFGAWNPPKVLNVSGAAESLRSVGELDGCRAMAWHPSGQMLALGEVTGRIHFVDYAKRQRLLSVNGHMALILDLHVSPDGRRLASAGEDGTVAIWDTANGDELFRFSPEGVKKFSQVRWSPDGMQLAAAGRGDQDASAIYVWSIHSEFDPSQSIGFLETGSVCRTLIGLPDAAPWVTRTAPARWRDWQGRLQEILSALNTEDGSFRIRNALVELIRSAGLDEVPSVLTACRTCIDEETDDGRAVATADHLLVSLSALDESSDAPFVSATIEILRQKAIRLIELSRFEEALLTNAEAISLADQLVEAEDATAEHWRLWQSVNVDTARVCSAGLTAIDDDDKAAPSAAIWKERLHQELQRANGLAARFPEWARLVDRPRESESLVPAWKWSIIDLQTREDLRAGRDPVFLSFWLEQFSTETFDGLYKRALCHALQGDRDGYQSVCHTMLDKFSHSTEGPEVSFSAWSCCLLPNSLDDYSVPIELLEHATEQDTENLAARCYLGAILFRAGRFQDARKQLRRLGETSDENSSPAYVWLFLAMAQHQLGETDEAIKWFDRADSHIDGQLERERAGKVSIPWNRRSTLRLLQAEANKLIHTDGPQAGADTVYGNDR